MKATICIYFHLPLKKIMKNNTLAVVMILFASLAFMCNNEKNELKVDSQLNKIQAKLGDTIILKKGDTAQFPIQNFKIIFNTIVSDSRCPKGVVCIWEGVAEGEFKFITNTETLLFNLSNGNLAGSNTKQVNNYIVKVIDFYPYPDTNQKEPMVSSAKIVVEAQVSNLVKGIVKDYNGLDGCGFVIILDNGLKLEPSKLVDPYSNSFKFRDNQRVTLAYTVLTDVVSTCMVGKQAQIDKIFELVE